jgi:2-polyprenyl-3-methyl-5-hydroxy-6-metoxy-1,4-benzoquinol methylase
VKEKISFYRSPDEPRGGAADEWNKLAQQIDVIQDAKNRALNPRLLAQAEKYAPRGAAFDYGCGAGEWVGMLAQNGHEVAGFDAADEQVAKARVHFGEAGSFMTRAEFDQQLPGLRGKFELVTSNLVLCVLEEAEQRQLLTEMKQLLKPGGTMIVSFCHPKYDFEPEGVVTSRFVPEGLGYNDTFKFTKRIKEITDKEVILNDNHRPLEYYEKLFNEFGLETVETAESDTLGTAHNPDFIIYTLRIKI